MKIAIVGSRDYPHPEKVRALINNLPADTVVISGGARGVDTWAEQAARARGLEVIIFPALWHAYGKRAGFIRNRQIVESADKVVAFWDGLSKGTKMSIDISQGM